MQHKLGPCPISEISIAILVSSEHRIDSIEAMHFLIDELKRTVPIWKKVSLAVNYFFKVNTNF